MMSWDGNQRAALSRRQQEVADNLQKFKVEVNIINFALDKSLFMCYNPDQVDKEIKVELDFSTGRDGTMSFALESQRRMAVLRSAGRDAGPPQAQDNGLERAYRAACARRECDRRLHLVRRRNLTNPVWNGTAL